MHADTLKLQYLLLQLDGQKWDNVPGLEHWKPEDEKYITSEGLLEQLERATEVFCPDCASNDSRPSARALWFRICNYCGEEWNTRRPVTFYCR